MSKLLTLFNGSQYARLNSIAGGTQNFSVRKQSDTLEATRQSNAVDFFGNQYQSEFDVNKPTLSVQGFAKASTAQNSSFSGAGTTEVNTGQASTANTAFDSYNRFANDAFRSKYPGTSGLTIHKYLATDSTKKYLTINSAAAGAVLTYNV